MGDPRGRWGPAYPAMRGGGGNLGNCSGKRGWWVGREPPLAAKRGPRPLRSGPAFPKRPPCARFVAGGPTDAGPAKISQVDFGEKNNFLSTTSRWLSTAAISPSTRAGPRGTVPNAESHAGPASKPGWPGIETGSRPPPPWLESVDCQFKKFYDGAFPFEEFLTHSAN